MKVKICLTETPTSIKNIALTHNEHIKTTPKRIIAGLNLLFLFISLVISFKITTIPQFQQIVILFTFVDISPEFHRGSICVNESYVVTLQDADWEGAKCARRRADATTRLRAIN